MAKPGRPRANTERLALNLRLPKGSLRAVAKAAASDARPVASWVTKLILDALEAE